MFELLLFLGFATLTWRFNSNVTKTSNNLDATAKYIAEAQAALKNK